jgi:signal transduction histidine kinase
MMALLANLGMALAGLLLVTAGWRSMMQARVQAPRAAGLLRGLSALPGGVDWRREAPGVTDLRRLLDAMGTADAALRVMGRPQELRQLLAHVVGIACHAMPRGGVLNVITVIEGREIVIEFMDEDSGRREPLLAALFRHGSNSRPLPLDADSGLATRAASCRRIVAEHGGRIEMRPSRLGALGLFIRLPLVSG